MSTLARSRPEEPAIPEEFLDKCHRVEEPDGYPYYQVESEHYAENGLIYTVKAIRGSNGHYYPTCTCPAGMEGIRCKHVRWAREHARQFHQFKKIGGLDMEVVDRHEWVAQQKICYVIRDDEHFYAVYLSPTEKYCYLCAVSQCQHVSVACQFEQRFHRELAAYNTAA